MSVTFDKVLELIEEKEIRISDHGYDELVEDGIFVREIIDSVKDAVIVEDYPDYPKGPCVLVFCDSDSGEGAAWLRAVGRRLAAVGSRDCSCGRRLRCDVGGLNGTRAQAAVRG